MSENRREFFRVIFHESVNGKITRLGEAPMSIVVDNISVNGMRFTSPVNIPMGERLECSFEILEQAFLLEGTIVRKSTRNDRVEYGVGFTIDQETSSQLFKHLNYYQIRQRKGSYAD
ncbi:PilZ domain-containing protein [Planomicrobium sp. Y74]|uniref:PilZ domain-containing protein n=1 Tax=Planomicrobium sp. Y74 TaxID=2478977 RepID=UPI000EF44E24|nr:PilZ domain-containing protein [Planomicrobium sp. Y74]RLQ90981.1 PilZ domain-containing protein [Planomicrobium sp. Y74]